MRGNVTFAKRQRERERAERKQEKAVKRAERRAERDTATPTEEGVDPDIAHIVPGPQPVEDEDE
ncbi:MAG: hypothetical protein KIT72_16270 [Polyangiaceae bacterium]|nr:hypothetical protein [Polyangiaceae bacterium]MCW5791974.1 hypothetical protein [Polyangiaceae bacterium]